MKKKSIERFACFDKETILWEECGWPEQRKICVAAAWLKEGKLRSEIEKEDTIVSFRSLSFGPEFCQEIVKFDCD